ncbi:MAG: hypothetical protein NC395_10765 [Prevotella sp.]|nr:hypothetical protein [Prevotella sp.]
MASVDWKKLKQPAEVKRIMFHNDQEKRLQTEHNNEHINKDLTQYNLQNVDYETACKRYDDRIEHLDQQEKANKRKDRVTAISLIVPIPNEIEDWDVSDFANRCNKIFTKKFGVKNMIASYVHVDEVHEYKDAETKQMRTSMRHMHVIFIPEKDEKLNAKAICHEPNFTEINEAVDKMCQETFGVKFMDGSKKKSRKSVERLKRDSLELQLDDVERKEDLLIGREIELDHYRETLETHEEKLKSRETELDRYKRNLDKYKQNLDKEKHETDIVYKAAYKKQAEAEQKLSEANEIMEEVTKQREAAQRLQSDTITRNAVLQKKADDLRDEKEQFEKYKQAKEKELNEREAASEAREETLNIRE